MTVLLELNWDIVTTLIFKPASVKIHMLPNGMHFVWKIAPHAAVSAIEILLLFL